MKIKLNPNKKLFALSGIIVLIIILGIGVYFTYQHIQNLEQENIQKTENIQNLTEEKKQLEEKTTELIDSLNLTQEEKDKVQQEMEATSQKLTKTENQVTNVQQQANSAKEEASKAKEEADQAQEDANKAKEETEAIAQFATWMAQKAGEIEDIMLGIDGAYGNYILWVNTNYTFDGEDIQYKYAELTNSLNTYNNQYQTIITEVDEVINSLN